MKALAEQISSTPSCSTAASSSVRGLMVEVAGPLHAMSVGARPTTKGYTATVFSELPPPLERAGPGTEQGTITGIFTVLVDGDDHNEPIPTPCAAFLTAISSWRAIAERGRYPAINVLKSVSRTVPPHGRSGLSPAAHRGRRQTMATYTDMEKLIRLGAYRAGTSTEVDQAIRLHKPPEAFLALARFSCPRFLAQGCPRFSCPR